jgi:hypothetical protein
MSSEKRQKLGNGDTRVTTTYNDGSKKIVTKREGLFIDKVKSVEKRSPPKKK